MLFTPDAISVVGEIVALVSLQPKSPSGKVILYGESLNIYEKKFCQSLSLSCI